MIIVFIRSRFKGVDVDLCACSFLWLKAYREGVDSCKHQIRRSWRRLLVGRHDRKEKSQKPLCEELDGTDEERVWREKAIIKRWRKHRNEESFCKHTYGLKRGLCVKKIQAFEIWCYRRPTKIIWADIHQQRGTKSLQGKRANGEP